MYVSGFLFFLFFLVSRGTIAQHRYHCGKLAIPLEGHWHVIIWPQIYCLWKYIFKPPTPKQQQCITWQTPTILANHLSQLVQLWEPLHTCPNLSYTCLRTPLLCPHPPTPTSFPASTLTQRKQSILPDPSAFVLIPLKQWGASYLGHCSAARILLQQHPARGMPASACLSDGLSTSHKLSDRWCWDAS